MPLESDIDALYRLPMAKFTGARNALAKRIGGVDGKRVKSLVKPAAAPSVVNRLYRQSKPIYERLLKAGSALRRAQLAALGGSGNSTAAHRESLAEAVQRAAQLAGDAGERSATDDLARMLEAVSLAPTHPETRGRLTALVRPAGFEALTGAPPALRLVRSAAASPRQPVSRAPAAGDARGRRLPSSHGENKRAGGWKSVFAASGTPRSPPPLGSSPGRWPPSPKPRRRPIAPTQRWNASGTTGAPRNKLSGVSKVKPKNPSESGKFTLCMNSS